MSRPETIEEKYKHAIMVLQAIAQTTGKNGYEYLDEWTEAETWAACRRAAYRGLKYLGEDVIMQNKRKKTDEEFG